MLNLLKVFVTTLIFFGLGYFGGATREGRRVLATISDQLASVVYGNSYSYFSHSNDFLMMYGPMLLLFLGSFILYAILRKVLRLN